MRLHEFICIVGMATSLRESVVEILKAISRSGLRTSVTQVNSRLMRPSMSVAEYVEAVKIRPITSMAQIPNISPDMLSNQSKALIQVVEDLTAAPGCVGVRPEGNGKHCLIVTNGRDREFIDDCVSWTLKGAHVTLLLSDFSVASGTHAAALTEVGKTIDSFDSSHMSPSEVERLVSSADIVRDYTSGFTRKSDEGLDIPALLSHFRVIGPRVESRLDFSGNDERSFETLNFLNEKLARKSEELVNEFLEICEGLRGQNVAGRPVCLTVDSRSVLPDHVVIHSAIAAINPFVKEGDDILIVVGGESNIRHDSVRRFVKFAKSSLGFNVTDESETETDGLISSVDSDPFRIVSQHLIPTRSSVALKSRSFEVVNCKPIQDDSVI